MPLITLPAHFDGDKICLDEPFGLTPNTRLIVTILPGQEWRQAKTGIRFGGLPEVWNTFPHLPNAEVHAFAEDLANIRTQFNHRVGHTYQLI